MLKFIVLNDNFAYFSSRHNIISWSQKGGADIIGGAFSKGNTVYI